MSPPSKGDSCMGTSREKGSHPLHIVLLIHMHVYFYVYAYIGVCVLLFASCYLIECGISRTLISPHVCLSIDMASSVPYFIKQSTKYEDLFEGDHELVWLLPPPYPKCRPFESQLMCRSARVFMPRLNKLTLNTRLQINIRSSKGKYIEVVGSPSKILLFTKMIEEHALEADVA